MLNFIHQKALLQLVQTVILEQQSTKLNNTKLKETNSNSTSKKKHFKSSTPPRIPHSPPKEAMRFSSLKPSLEKTQIGQNSNDGKRVRNLIARGD